MITLALLVACGGGGKTVNGQVLDDSGKAVAGRTIIAGGVTTTTDSNGQFTVAGISTPYDLVIIEPAPAKVATVYKDLTRTDPKVLDVNVSSYTPPNHSALVGGAISGGDAFPTPDGTVTVVSWGSPETYTYQGFDGSPYSLAVNWSGPATTTGTVHVLQLTTDGQGTVTGYQWHGTKTGVSLTADDTVSNADVALSPVQTEIASVTISPPEGHQIIGRNVSLNFADGTTFDVEGDFLSDSALSVPLPSDIGATATVVATAWNSDVLHYSAATGTTSFAQLIVQPGATGATLSLPVPAIFTAPARDATGVDSDTDLAWTPLVGGIHVLYLRGEDDDPQFVIVTGGTHARIPKLTGWGLGLPSGRPYSAGLSGVGPYESVDAFAASGMFPPFGLGFGTSSRSTFTTK